MPGYELTASFFVSLVTSAVFGSLAFLVGARSAKERADRNELRAIYKDTYAHFQGLKDAADIGKLHSWSTYLDRKGEVSPPIHALERDGTLCMFPNTLSKQFLELEKDALTLGWKFSDYITRVFAPQFEAKSAEILAEPFQAVVGERHIMAHVREFLIEGTGMSKKINGAFAGNCGVGIELLSNAGRSKMVYLFPQKLKGGSVEQFVDAVTETSGASPEVKELLAERKKLIKRLQEALNTVAARIKDPHPLRETLKASLPDLFRR